eukprot:GEMP01035557.1.p1 GENE.GEMP01035557.1~~GEMP01035557.1.p1  ORF type:complete len:353 (+),score=46.06 GEMP01035557.1:68-1060(+)
MAPVTTVESPTRSTGSPKIRVCPSRENDERMVIGGDKGKSVKDGVLQLTGCVNRSHSEPFFRTQPGGWHASRYRNDLHYSAYLSQARKDTIGRNASIIPKCHVQGVITTVEDHVPPPPGVPGCHEPTWYNTVTRNRSSPGAPMSNTHYRSFQPGGVGPTSADIIRQSKNHVGYVNGQIRYGDQQESAISTETPSWFVGVRMNPGPYGVPRFPKVRIQGRDLVVQKRLFSKGDNLSIIETHETGSSRSPDAAKKSFDPPRFDDWNEYKRNVDGGFRCVHGLLMCDRSPCENKKLIGRSYMIAGGCVAKHPYFPRSDYVSLDPPFVYKTPTQ